MRPHVRIPSAPALLIVTLLALAACSVSDRAPGGPPEWALAQAPLLAVGDTEDSDSAVFSRITDVRLLPSGTLAVADAGASAVLLFDAQGVRTAKLGRRGRGPGEFAGQISLARRSDDAVAVWDPSQRRWSEVRVGRASVESLPDSLGDAAWAHAGVVVLGEGHVPEWAPSLLRTLADSLPAMRLAFLDETSLLWVNTDAGRRAWRAYDGITAVGALNLPAGFRPTQFRADRVVGIQADSIGLERVMVYGFARPAGIVPVRGAVATPPADSGQRATLTAAMRNAVVAQEVHYAQHARYTMRTDSLMLEMPPGATLRIIEADARSWRGVGTVAATGYSCGLYIGIAPPRGWGEGAPQCAWR
ncbi:MAG: hypothetical protein KF689_02285 [Gemmatimonadaceae bacterium]|nr:hypothetical protein [Gemmatimonadaceae bacterium]MCW5826764.1 hypothetical protein [Gemmatimonadaceae bacterium]